MVGTLLEPLIDQFAGALPRSNGVLVAAGGRSAQHNSAHCPVAVVARV